jgi:hypothetical protein
MDPDPIRPKSFGSDQIWIYKSAAKVIQDAPAWAAEIWSLCTPAGGVWHLCWTPYGIGQIMLDFQSVVQCIQAAWFLWSEHNIQFIFNIEYIYTEKGADIKCYQSRMSTWTVALQHFQLRLGPPHSTEFVPSHVPSRETVIHAQWMKKKSKYSMNSFILRWQYYTYMQ